MSNVIKGGRGELPPPSFRPSCVKIFELQTTNKLFSMFLRGYNSTGGIQLSFQGVYNSTGGIQLSFLGVYNSSGIINPLERYMNPSSAIINPVSIFSQILYLSIPTFNMTHLLLIRMKKRFSQFLLKYIF